MGVYEMIDIVTSENIYNAYQSRENYRDKSGAPNWAEWASKYPDASRMLNEIAKEIANGE